MADGTSDAVDSATLEGPAAAWLAERAEELDVSQEELLERVVAAYRAAEAGDVPDSVVSEQELDERLAEVEDDLAAVEDDLAALDDDVAEKIRDVRDRVIQVKREADAKAPADHDHPDLAGDVREAEAAVAHLESEVADVAATVEGLSDRVDAGFDNFEEVLTYLRDETDDLDRKLRTLATAVLGMRESVASLAAASARRRRVDRLKRTANEQNVRQAECAACESELTVSLLTAPECPACGATFEDVEANPGWFGTHKLVTGTAPALEAGAADTDAGDEEWLSADTETLEAMASGEGDGDGGPEIVDTAAVGGAEPADVKRAEESEVGDVGDSGTPPDDGRGTDDEAVDAEDARLDAEAESLDVGDGADDLNGDGLDVDDTLDLDEESLDLDGETFDVDDNDGETNA
ncbi:MAG: hypothetical protein ABEH83_06970 [Halobacterium sp.]